MKCTSSLMGLVPATMPPLFNAQVIGNPFFSCPAGTTGGCCLSYNSGASGVDCISLCSWLRSDGYVDGSVMIGPIPGHEKEFVCAFREREKKSCCTTGGNIPSRCVAAPASPTAPITTTIFGRK